LSVLLNFGILISDNMTFWSELSLSFSNCNSRFQLNLFASLRGYRLNRG
jgi:hypothetical protein